MFGLKWKALLITTILVCSQVSAQTCESFFTSRALLPSHLASQEALSDTQIFKAAKKAVLGDLSISAQAKESLLRYIDVFFTNKRFKQDIEIEIARRDLKAAAEKMGIRVYRDPRYILAQNKHYLSWLTSLTINGTANYLSLRYLGTSIGLVHLPLSRFFKPEKIPDDVLQELLMNSGGPRTNAFFSGADVVLNNVRRVFNAVILISVIIHGHEMIMDPGSYMDRVLSETVVNLSSEVLRENVALLETLKAKRVKYERLQDQAKVSQIDNIIQGLRDSNEKLIKFENGSQN